MTDAPPVGVRRRLGGPRAAVAVALWVLAVAAIAVSLVVQYRNPVLPGDSWQSQGQLVDFRDSVWTPGRYLLSGGNPYDTATYLADVPWTQGLALYAPAWLLLGVVLGPLPYLLANAIYQLLGIAVVFLLVRLVVRTTMPRVADLAVPVGMIWLVVWAAGRYAYANVSTGLVVLGTLLVLRGIWLRRTEGGDAARAWTSVGVACSMIKPQFGLLVVVAALAGRRWDAVWRGLAGLALLSLPTAVACVVGSGGLSGFLAGIGSNLARSTSPDSAVGLDSPFNVSIDLVAQLARLDLGPSGWVRAAVPVLGFVLVAVVARRARSLLVLSAGVLTAVLLCGFVHQFYDLLVLVLPTAVGIAWLLERARAPWPAWLLWLCVALPTVHVHRVTTNVVPGLSTTGADRIDTVLLVVGLLLSLAALLRPRWSGPTTGPLSVVAER